MGPTGRRILQAETIAACYRELRGGGSRSLTALLTVLDDDDVGARLWAGAHALEFAPDLGEPVLIELAAGDSLAAFNARMALRQWRDSQLTFP
jgi:hypothetical protein